MRVISCIIIFIITPAYAQLPQVIAGRWRALDKKAVEIEITSDKNSDYFGKVVKNETEPDKVASLILSDLQFNSSNSTYTGKMTPPGLGFSLDAEVILIHTDTIKIVARKSIVSKTILFVRLK